MLLCNLLSRQPNLTLESDLEQSIQTMERHKKGTWNAVYYMMWFVCRLIWLNWWLDHLSKIKYRIQVSRWWPTVREWRVTKALNYLWLIPKRILFDNKTDPRIESRQHHLLESSRSAPISAKSKDL